MSADIRCLYEGLTRPCAINKDVIVQVSKINSHENVKLLSLKNLIGAVHNDPDKHIFHYHSLKMAVVQTLITV